MARSEAGPGDRVAAVPARARDIPVIDFARFTDGDDAARRAVADAIAAAARDGGVFALAGHGVTAATIDAAFAAANGFFALAPAEKARAAATADWYRGWVPVPHAAGFSRDTRLFEQYRLQATSDGEATNRWPTGMPGFERAITDYLAAMRALGDALLHAFALALAVRADRFDAWFANPLSQLSLFRYPPLPGAAEADVSNMVPHSDEGPFTILAQRGIGGLEVRRPDGTWIAAPVAEGLLTVNVGDMLHWWSNGAFHAPEHRVRNRSGGARTSIAWFVSPDRATRVAPLPELGAPRFAGVEAGAHLRHFHATLEGHDVR